MSVFSGHMQGSHSVISNKLRLHTKINPYSYNKNRTIASGAFSPFKICVHNSYLAPRLLHTSNIAFQNVCPLVVFGPPCCQILATGLNKNPENLCYEQTHISVLVLTETIIEC